MANKIYEESHIQAIADAIRESNATDRTYRLSEMADAIRNGGLKYAIKETTTNSVIRDSAEYRMLNMKVYGHSWQNGTPTPTEPQPIESAKEVKVLGGNLLDIPSKASSDSEFYGMNTDGSLIVKKQDTRANASIPSTQTLKAGTHTISVSEDEKNANLKVEIYDDVNQKFLLEHYFDASSVSFTVENDTEISFKVIRVDLATEFVCHIMLNEGTEALAYEPYKAPQTLTLPNLHEGDVVDYSKKKIVRNSTFKNLYELYWKQGNANNNGDGMTFYAEPSEFGTLAYLSTHFRVVYETESGWESLNVGECLTKDGYIVACTNHSSLEEFKLWLSAENVQALIKLAEPIETDLTDEEVARFMALHMNYPTTTIVGDAEITYVADPENYKAQH